MKRRPWMHFIRFVVRRAPERVYFLAAAGLAWGEQVAPALAWGEAAAPVGLAAGDCLSCCCCMCVCVRERGFDQLFDDHKTGSVTDEDETYLGRSSGGGNVLLGVLLGSLL